jgi:hypothetical protein
MKWKDHINVWDIQIPSDVTDISVRHVCPNRLEGVRNLSG